MKKPINELERLKLIAGLINEINYNDSVYGVKRSVLTEGETKEAKADEAVKAEVKAKKPSEKKPDILHIDQANPYEYRHGLQHELAELGEYTDEALEKAKTTVLKNLAKDANFYSNLLNAEKSPYTFKETETDKPGMQAKADGHLKKEAKKDEKANVQDSLGKKEEGSKKPKGVKVMPDKGVTGSEKTIKEGSFMGGVDLGASFDKMKGQMNAEEEFENLMKKYDWYAEMSDDSRKWDAQQSMERQLSQLAKSIGVDKAVALFNQYAPSDRKVTSSDSMWSIREDKHTKIKEALKKALKEVDPQLQKLSKDEENAEKTLAAILTKKAALLNKPGTQG